MKKRYKRVLVIGVVVLILACAYPCYFLVWHYVQERHFPYKGVDLEVAFYEEFQGKYSEVLWVREEGLMVFLACLDEGQGTRYVYYEKAPFFDWWVKGEDGLREAGDSSVMLETDGRYHANRMYLSLNPQEIGKIVVTTDGGETVLRTNPEEPFIFVTESGFDSIAFFTEDEKEISEEEFLKTQ